MRVLSSQFQDCSSHPVQHVWLFQGVLAPCRIMAVTWMSFVSIWEFLERGGILRLFICSSVEQYSGYFEYRVYQLDLSSL